MMKRIHSAVLAVLLMVSLGLSSSNALAKNNNGFIAGACAVGAALFGVAGAVALADWYYSETDDQLIARTNAEYCDIYAQYYQTIAYFETISGLNYYVATSYKPFGLVSEAVLYELATHIWNNNSTQHTYRLNVIAAKNKLQSCVDTLRKRIRSLEGKCCKYEDQQRLRIMRKLVSDAEDLLIKMTMFADCLHYHKTYFNLYDSIDTVRARYLQEITILESGRYSIPMEIKNYVVNCDSGQYAFRTFVTKIESDIATLRSDINSLAYNYDARRQYAHTLINYLVEIKNIVINDPRYQQELYQWEQARLQRLRIEALEAQARAERERVALMYEQNRILEERNWILSHQDGCHYYHSTPCTDIWIDVTV